MSSAVRLGLVVLAVTSLAAPARAFAFQGDHCTGPTPIAGVGSFPFTTVGMNGSQFSDGADGLCEASVLSFAADTFFVWTVPATGAYEITTTSTGPSHPSAVPFIYLYFGSDCFATCVGVSSSCDPDLVSQSSYQAGVLTAGDTYLIRLLWTDQTGTMQIAQVPPPPPNDTCVTPTAIGGAGAWAFDLVNATSSRFSGFAGGAIETNENVLADLFYAWTAPATDDYLFEVDLPGKFPVLELYDQGDCTGAWLAADVTNIFETGPSRIRRVGLAAGSTYLVQVSSWTCDGFGPGTLTVESNPGPPSNDDCSNPDVAVGYGTFVVDNRWATNGAFTGTPPGFGGPCQNSTFPFHINDVFVTWTAPETTKILIDAPGAAFGTLLRIHDGSDCNAVCRMAEFLSDEPFVLDVVAGESLLFGVGDSQSASRGLNDQSGDLGLIPLRIRPVGLGHDCTNPVPILGTGAFPWDLADVGASEHGTVSSFLCHGEIGARPDTFFLWTVPCSGNYRFEVVTPADPFAVQMDAFAGGGCSTACIGSDSAAGPVSAFSIPALSAGEQVLIQIGSNGDLSAAGDLVITRLGGNDCGGLALSCPPLTPHYQGGDVTLGASSFLGGLGTGLHLEATGGPSGAFGLVLVSAGAGSNLPVFQGTLCLDAPIARYNAQTAANQNLPQLDSIGQFDGNGVFQSVSGNSSLGSGFDVPAALPNPVGGAIQPGSTWYLQVWYRDEDSGGAPSANFSDVLGATYL